MFSDVCIISSSGRMHAVAILGQSVMQGDCCYKCCLADCGLSVMPATCMKGSVLYSGAFIDSLAACVCECVCVCVCVCCLIQLVHHVSSWFLPLYVCIFHWYIAVCPKPSTSVDIFGYRSKHWEVQADSCDADHTECITLVAGRHVYYWSCLDR